MGMYAIIILEINFNASTAHTRRDHFYESNEEKRKRLSHPHHHALKFMNCQYPKRRKTKQKSIIDGHFSLL